jgi:hypothetical protein
MNVFQQRANPTCADFGGTFYGVVGKITKPNAKIEIWARCGFDNKTNQPLASWYNGPLPCKGTCVKKSGGLIILTQTAKTMAKFKSMVQIEITGLTYAQLVRVANGLKPLK